MDWIKLIQSFHWVVEHQSFSAAAQYRYASSSTLTKHIQALEHQVGATLLYRNTRQVELTEAGVAFYEKSQGLLVQFQALFDEVHDHRGQVSGRLRVTVPLTLSEGFLSSHLVDFASQYPDIQLELVCDNGYVDLIRERIDVAIRVGRDVDQSFQSHYLGKKPIGVFAAPQYLQSSSPIDQPSDMRTHRCLVHSDFSVPHLWRFKEDPVSVRPVLSCNHLPTLMKAAMAGQGLLYVSEYVAHSAVAQGALEPVLRSHWHDGVDYHVVFKREKHCPKKIHCFVDFIRALAW